MGGREDVDDVEEGHGRVLDRFHAHGRRLAAAAARRCSGCNKDVDEALEAPRTAADE